MTNVKGLPVAPMRLAIPLETVPAIAVSKVMDSGVMVRDNIANLFSKIAAEHAISSRPAPFLPEPSLRTQTYFLCHWFRRKYLFFENIYFRSQASQSLKHKFSAFREKDQNYGVLLQRITYSRRSAWLILNPHFNLS